MLFRSSKGKQKEGESDAKYRARLVRLANELEETEWKGLSEEAQEWVNAGVKALNKKKDVADFPGAEEEAEEKPAKKGKKGKAADEDEEEEEEEADADEDADEEEEEEEEEADEDEKPAKKSKKGRKPADDDDADADADEDEEKPAKKSKKGGKETKRGASMVYRRLLIEHRNSDGSMKEGWDKARLLKAVEKEGYSLSKNVAGIVYYDTHACLKVLAEMKLLRHPKAE